MAIIIDLEERRNRPPDNIITSRPFHFRRAGWESSDFVMMLRSHSERLERQRGENLRQGLPGVSGLPPHYVLSGGMGDTVRGLFFHKDNEKSMQDVYYLAGLVDCMINQINPLLRTDSINDLYRKVMTLKQTLNVNWFGTLDQVLLPLDAGYYNFDAYKNTLSEATTLQDLYGAIREGCGDMFAVLSVEYVFYTPGMGGSHVR